MDIPIVQILIRYLSHSQSLYLLWQSWHSLNTVISSSADLTCFSIENILFFPHLKQVYNEFSRGSCGFIKLSLNIFYLFSSRIKNRMFKNWIHFLDKQKVNLKGQTKTSFLVNFVLNRK